MADKAVLSLKNALDNGRLEDFIAQAEAAGFGPIDPAQFDTALEVELKAPRSLDRTSRSPSRGGSTGK